MGLPSQKGLRALIRLPVSVASSRKTLREHAGRRGIIPISATAGKATKKSGAWRSRSGSLRRKHWTLLTGLDDSVRTLAAVLGVRYMKIPSGEFAHSSVITVLDSKGNIQQQQAGLKKEHGEVVSVISRLLSPTK
jgi:protein SCO1/2